jgi:chromosome segregation ATPase
LNYTTLVEQITTVLPNCASLQANILSAVLSDELQAEIWKVILGKVQKEHATCQAYAASLHQHLISATIALLLTLALALPTTGQTLPLGITTALVSKQRQLPHLIHQCNHEISDLEPPRVSLFQQKSTPHTGQHLQNWRGRLKSELESQGFYQRDIIMRSVAQICQDLEARCDTVEEPLRREREKSQELQQQVAELRERVASLEVQAADDRFHSEGLEDEKLIISDERDSLSAKLKQLEATTSEIIRKADNVLIKAHEDFNAKELELRSTLITYEESIRAHDKETEAQNGTLDRLREDLEHVQNQRTSLSEQHTILQHQLCNVEQKLNSERETVRTQSGQIAQLKTRNLELEHQVQGTETKLKATAVQLNDLLVNHRELIQSSDEAYRNLDHKYTRDMEAAAIKAKDDCETLDARLQEAIQHGQREKDAHDVTRRDLQLLQISIPPLQDKIDELTEFCTEQEEELEELRTLRKNVLASFGYASQNPLAIRSASRIHKGIVDSQTPGQPREHRRRKSAVQISNEAPTASRGTHGVTSTAMENIANASFASSDSHSSQNGSTPKRSKPRPSFKVPTMHTPHTHKPILASRSVSKKLSPIKRSALRQMSPNRRHTTVGFGVSENGEEHSNELRSIEKRRGSFREDQADHDMEEILVGTPLTPGNFTAGTGRVPENDEETVGEF